MLQLFDDQAVGSIGKPAKARSALWSVLIHMGVLLFILSLSLSPVFQTLPQNLNLVHLLAPPPPPPAPPPPPLAQTAAPRVRRPARVFEAKLTAPVAIPQGTPDLEIEIEAPPDAGFVGGVPGGVPGGIGGGVLGGFIGGSIASVAPPPPPPPPNPAVVQPPPPPPPPAPKLIQVSAAIQEAKILEMPRPEYPLAAKLARIQGTVRLKAMIDCEGKITQLEVLNGHPLLAQAARSAVQRWRYRPTLIGDDPVNVATEIIVNFNLL